MAHLVIISDLHLGQSFALDPFSSFLHDLRKRVRPDLLILNGDIFELAWFKWSELESQVLFRDSLDELRDFASSIETVLIPGNHDPRNKLLPDKLLPIRIVSYDAQLGEVIALDNIIFTHGHQFDMTTHLWDSLLKLPIRTLLPPLYLKLYGTPYQLKSAQKEKDYHELAFWVTGRAALHAVRAGKYLIFGHTHLPLQIELESGLKVINCGDWRDSLSFVEVQDREIKLKFWR